MIYLILRHSQWEGWIPVVMGTFTTKEKALEAFENIQIEKNVDYTIEEWPSNVLSPLSVQRVAYK